MTVWLSVDTDDCCHLPKQRGHPLRSSGPETGWRTTGYAAGHGPLHRMGARWTSSHGLPDCGATRLFRIHAENGSAERSGQHHLRLPWLGSSMLVRMAARCRGFHRDVVCGQAADRDLRRYFLQTLVQSAWRLYRALDGGAFGSWRFPPRFLYQSDLAAALEGWWWKGLGCGSRCDAQSRNRRAGMAHPATAHLTRTARNGSRSVAADPRPSGSKGMAEVNQSESSRQHGTGRRWRSHDVDALLAPARSRPRRRSLVSTTAPHT
jgi:hypothetical protein